MSDTETPADGTPAWRRSLQRWGQRPAGWIAARRPDRWPGLAQVGTGVLVAAVFVLGLLVGGVLVGVAADDPVVVPTPGGAGAGADATGPDLPSGDASAEFVVSGACLGAVNAAQDTVLLLDDVGSAASELDAARLDAIVRSLMPLQSRLETGLAECDVSTRLDPGAGPMPAPPGGEDPAEGTPPAGGPGGEEPPPEEEPGG